MFRTLTTTIMLVVFITTRAGSGTVQSAPAAPAADTLSLRHTVYVLADPALEGRCSGAPGNAQAREWLRARLANLGLEPVRPGGYEQPFSVAGVALDTLAATLIDTDGHEYPLLLSLHQPALPLTRVSLRPWPQREAVPRVESDTLLLRQGPADARGQFFPSVLQRQASAAGAAGLVLVPHPDDSAGIYQRYLGRVRQRDTRLYTLAGDAPAPLLAYADGSAAARLYERASARQDGWRVGLPAQRPLSLKGHNLVARLPGAPAGAPVVLLIAHYDHLGKSSQGVFPGADDNASGVAVLLETARLLADQRLQVELRFLFSDAEELGLLGAETYARTQPAPHLVINLDSVGRAAVDSVRKLKDPAALDPRLLIHWRSAAARDTGLDDHLRAAGFSVQPGAGPMFERGGDHWVFAKRAVPAHFLFGGFHPDYNTVHDVAERIRVERLARLAEGLAAALSAGAGLLDAQP
jgi:hypothetical protein